MNAQSIKDKLMNFAKANGKNFNLILDKYFHERLIYRVSISRYAQNFCLKDGTLLYARDPLHARPTLDIDLLGISISNNNQTILSAFREICDIKCREDSIVFSKDSLKAAPITIDQKYPGTRLTVIGYLGKIRKTINIDIGFGDVVTPNPALLRYPSLLPDIPSPEIFTFWREMPHPSLRRVGM